jgi:hypothetical protein
MFRLRIPRREASRPVWAIFVYAAHEILPSLKQISPGAPIGSEREEKQHDVECKEFPPAITDIGKSCQLLRGGFAFRGEFRYVLRW